MSMFCQLFGSARSALADLHISRICRNLIAVSKPTPHYTSAGKLALENTEHKANVGGKYDIPICTLSLFILQSFLERRKVTDKKC